MSSGCPSMLAECRKGWRGDTVSWNPGGLTWGQGSEGGLSVVRPRGARPPREPGRRQRRLRSLWALSAHFSSCTRGNGSADLDPAVALPVVHCGRAGPCFHLEPALARMRLRLWMQHRKNSPLPRAIKMIDGYNSQGATVGSHSVVFKRQQLH